MAISYKVLGQANPVSGTLTTLYTVPSATQAVVSTLAICNYGVSATVRAAIRVAGAAIANSQYILYDSTVNQYDSLFLTLGMTLGATDVVSVNSNSSNVSFSLYGSEIA